MERVLQQPIIVVALSLVVGCVVGWHWEFSPLVPLVMLIILVLANLWLRSDILLFIAVALAGLSITSVEIYNRGDLPLEGDYRLSVVKSNEVRVRSAREVGGEWGAVDRRLYFRADSTLGVAMGDEMVVNGRVRDFGRTGFIYISERGVRWRSSTDERTISTVQRINDFFAAKVASLRLDHDSESLVNAIVLGRRGDMSEELTEAYRGSGASHLLAISGLHVGMVLLFIMFVLRPLALIPMGNIYSTYIVVALLWLFALIVGMSPSVVRASIMFTLLLLVRLTTNSYSSIAALSLAVVLMVMCDPAIIFNVGFQLSVVAVLSILIWAIPVGNLMGRCLWRFEMNRFVRAILKFTLFSLIIGVACSVATMPIIAMTFGRVIWWGALLNPIIIVTSYIIIALSLCWLMFGFAAIAPPFRWMVDTVCAVQNDLLRYASANLSPALDMRLDTLSVVTIYALYIAITLLVWRLYQLYRNSRIKAEEERQELLVDDVEE